MSWTNNYVDNNRVWGDDPSELAMITTSYLKEHPGKSSEHSRIIDVGCGYGRDTLYLSSQLNLHVLGIDNSETAIQMAADAALGKGVDVSFRYCDFKDIDKQNDNRFDILFAANLYHVLRPDDRKAFRQTAQRITVSGGLFFLNSLSVNDGEEYGKGTPVPSEPNSFTGNKYLHFCTREELLDDFKFLNTIELYEHSYREPHKNGSTHHHKSWILVGELKSLP